MKLKGNYSDLVTYAVGDVVVWTDGTVYILRKLCKAGVPPTMSLYWERLSQFLAAAVRLIMDGIGMAEDGALTGKVANNLTTSTEGKVLDARQGKALKDLIDALTVDVSGISGDLADLSPDTKTIRLASSTASSTKLFDITVTDDGTISATEYTPPVAEEET